MLINFFHPSNNPFKKFSFDHPYLINLILNHNFKKKKKIGYSNKIIFLFIFYIKPI